MSAGRRVAVIAGAGPAGLTAAWEMLARTDVHPVVIEPTAAIGGTMLASATPFTPYGCFGFGTSTRIASIIGTSDATGMR